MFSAEPIFDESLGVPSTASHSKRAAAACLPRQIPASSPPFRFSQESRQALLLMYITIPLKPCSARKKIHPPRILTPVSIHHTNLAQIICLHVRKLACLLASHVSRGCETLELCARGVMPRSHGSLGVRVRKPSLFSLLLCTQPRAGPAYSAPEGALSLSLPLSLSCSVPLSDAKLPLKRETERERERERARATARAKKSLTQPVMLMERFDGWHSVVSPLVTLSLATSFPSSWVANADGCVLQVPQLA